MRFSAGSDSPVSTASSHSSPSASQQPQVRRDHVADLDPDDVAGHQLGHVDRAGVAVAQRERRVPQLGVQRLDRALRAVLVEEAEPDAEPADQEDDERVGALADEGGGDRRREQQEEQRVAELPAQDGERARPVAAQRVRADLSQPPAGLGARQPPRAGAQPAQGLADGERRDGGQVAGAVGTRRSPAVVPAIRSSVPRERRRTRSRAPAQTGALVAGRGPATSVSDPVVSWRPWWPPPRRPCSRARRRARRTPPPRSRCRRSRW